MIGTFTWQNALPGQHIWSIILPIVSAIGVLVAIAAMLVARRLAKMSTQLENSERRTRHMSRHDGLTGLPNRFTFGEALNEAVASLPRKSFAVIACDLDRFKAVNDTYGHAAGDAVIREVADRLAREVGDAGLVSRTGGDEFILLITGFADKKRLNLLCAGLIETVLAPIQVDRGPLGQNRQADVGVSLGVAQAPLCGATDSAIMRAADEALYAAKELGRGRAVFAEDTRRTTEPAAEEARVA
jgi:diguanylate cyclase (GGDEF)-like protein